MKRHIRRSLLKIIKSTGIFAAWRRLHKHDIAILMLHGTADPNRPSKWRPLRPQSSPAQIDWCLSVIKRYYNFISFDEAIAILKGDKPPVDYGFVLTFDDGYRNNIEDALPVLRKHGASMTIFIPVSNVENRKPLWFDRLDYVLQSAAGDGHMFQVGGKTFQFSTSGKDALQLSYANFRKMIKEELTDEKEFSSKIEEIITHFERSNGQKLGDIFEDDPWSALLKWEEIIRVQGNDVCFGSHTMDHYRVGNLKKDVLQYQFLESKKFIENRTGNDCKYIAYPDDSFTEAAALVASECGYKAAVTTMEGINQIGCNPMTLKRVCIPLTSDPVELLAYVSGFSWAISI